MGSILRPKSSAEIIPNPTPTHQTTTYPLPTTLKIQQRPNHNCPNQTHQFNEYLLYESEFHGDTYVSAHLQRLQHGLVDSPNVHSDRKHVTFVALEFCFHPAFEHDHRFRNCIIEVTASRDRGDGAVDEKGVVGKEMLRFIKYAPHLAFGRISSESLKWNFQLGAKLGVTQGPVDLSINPSGSYERDRTVGTMMKIQGTTRSISPALLPPNSAAHSPPNRHDLRDRKVVWSLEENEQQEAGLPREFTFVFLVEQPHVAGGQIVNDMVYGDISRVFKNLTIGIKVKPSVTGFGVDGFDNDFQYTTVRGEIGQRFCTFDELQESGRPELLTQIKESATIAKDSAKAAVKKGTSSIRKQISGVSASDPGNAPLSASTDKVQNLADSVDGSASDALATIFRPNRSSSVTPEKQKTLQRGGKSPGQRQLPVSSTSDIIGLSEKSRSETMQTEKSMAPEVERKLFNFALLEGNFEDLIELPGNAVTSMQPTLPEPGKK